MKEVPGDVLHAAAALAYPQLWQRLRIMNG